MKRTLFVIVAIIVILGAFYLVNKQEVLAPAVTSPAVVDKNLAEKTNVENYLRENISKLSSVKAVLGGTWYVVSDTVDLAKKSGTVIYEDGHIQSEAKFNYSYDSISNTVTVSNFTVTNPNQKTGQTPIPATNKSGVSGTVTLSPTCPVERIPPDPNCAPKGYATSINIMKSGSAQIIKTIQSNAQGVFSVELTLGSYVLQAQGGNVLPRCGEVSVLVKSNQYTKTEISCDTGIR